MQNDSRTLQCSKIMAHVDKLNKECCEMEEVRRELRETTQGLADDMGAKVWCMMRPTPEGKVSLHL